MSIFRSRFQSVRRISLRAAATCFLTSAFLRFEQCGAQTIPQPSKPGDTTSLAQPATKNNHNAVEAARDSLAEVETRYGPSHTNSILALERLVVALERSGDLNGAKSSCQKACNLREEAFGRENVDTATTIHLLGQLHLNRRELDDSLRCFEVAAAIRERLLGSNHPDTAKSLNNIGCASEMLGNYSKAQQFYQRSLSIAEQAFGAEHTNTLFYLRNLAKAYYQDADYPKAKPLLQTLLACSERKLGREDPLTMEAQRLFAVILGHERSFERATALLEECLRVSEKTDGPEHPLTAPVLLNLGLLYQSMGQYSNAAALLRRNLEICEKAMGPLHLETATALEAMGSLFTSLRDYGRAKSAFERSLEIREKVCGDGHVIVLRSLLLLGYFHSLGGDRQRAGVCYQRVVAISDNIYGPDDQRLAPILAVLSNFYLVGKDYAMAETMFEKSLRMSELRYGKEHPLCSLALMSLGRVCLESGNYHRAVDTFTRVVRNDEAAGGSAVFEHYRGLAFAQWGLGETAKAKEAASNALKADTEHLVNILAFASAEERLNYHQARDPYCLVDLTGDSSDWANALLRNKGVVLDSLIEDQLAAAAVKNPTIAGKVQEYRTLIRKAQILQAPPLAAGQAAILSHKQELSSLKEKTERSRNELAALVPPVTSTRRALNVECRDVQSALPPGAVLLEFVCYWHYLGKHQFEARCGVLIAPGAAMNSSSRKLVPAPVWLPLGAARSIGTNLNSYNTAMRHGRHGDEAALKRLYAQLFEPIEQHLPADTRTLFIVPDSLLNFLNFGTLLQKDGTFLAEKLSIKYLASGRDLLGSTSLVSEPRSLIAFSNPAFSTGLVEIPKVTTSPVMTMHGDDRRDYGGLRLEPLPGTESEASFLKANAAKWNVLEKCFRGGAATEVEVRALQSPYILHLATHGFFLPSPIATKGDASTPVSPKSGPAPLNNPMQRSGLALAGAQATLDAWKRGEVPPAENDGILTAQEVGDLNLQNTWLVVLSACDTGIGEARNGEGVLGLRRGFVQAGAKNLLMTLWPISDKWSVEIMKAFYEKAMVSGDAPQAMADVQAEWLSRLRKEKGVLIAARIAGPFVLSTRGRQSTK